MAVIQVIVLIAADERWVMQKIFLLQLNNKNLLKLGADNVLKINKALKSESINTQEVADILCNPDMFTPICYYSTSKTVSDTDLLVDAYRNCDTYANNLCYFHNRLFGEQEVAVTKEFTYKPNWFLAYGDVFFTSDRLFVMSKNEHNMFVEVEGIGERFKKMVMDTHFPDQDVAYFIDMKSASFERAAKHARTVIMEDRLQPEEAIPLMGRRTKIAYMVDDLINTFLAEDLDFNKACRCLSKYTTEDKNDVFSFFVYGTKGDQNSPSSRFIQKIARVDAVVKELNRDLDRGMVQNKSLEDKINRFVDKTKNGLIGITRDDILSSFKYRTKRREVKIGRGRVLEIGMGY